MNRSENVKRWRKRTKQRMVEAMGGGCQICGYNKCAEALDFHHIDPKEKDFTFGKIRSNPRSWNKIVAELRKCIMLCSNCHREVHYGASKIPKFFFSFNEDYVEYKTVRKSKLSKLARTHCPDCGTVKRKNSTHCKKCLDKYKKLKIINYDCCKCGNKKSIKRKYCSTECACKSRRKVDWKITDLKQLLKNNKNNLCAVGRELGISDNAVRKQCIKTNTKFK